MFLKDSSNGHLIEVLDTVTLFDPSETHFEGRYNWGEDLPEPEPFAKANVIFPSGEPLPRCWVDMHYRDDELRR
jgi:hypothetical protein